MKIRNSAVATSFLAVAFFLNHPAFAETGVTETEVLVGTTRDLTSKEDSRAAEIAAGQKLHFSEINSAGGIHGRKIVLKEYDDAYDPKRTFENVKKLIEQDKVFSIFGTYGSANLNAVSQTIANVGIPTVSVSASIGGIPANQRSFIYSVKATYTQEAAEIVRFAVNIKKWHKLAVFFQEDALGEEGRGSIVKALHDSNVAAAVIKGFDRKALNIDETFVEAVTKSGADAVVIFGNAPGGLKILELLEKSKLVLPILAASPLVAPTFLSSAAKSKREIYFFQGYPLVSQVDVPLVADYRKACVRAAQKPGESGLIGYLDAVVFEEALKLTGRELTRKRLLETLNEKMNALVLKGIDISYGPDRHSGISRIRVSVLKGDALAPLP